MTRRKRLKEIRQLRAWRDSVLAAENLGRKAHLFTRAWLAGWIIRIWLAERHNWVVTPGGWRYLCQCDKRHHVYEHLTAAIYRHHARRLRGKPIEEA